MSKLTNWTVGGESGRGESGRGESGRGESGGGEPRYGEVDQVAIFMDWKPEYININFDRHLRIDTI